MQILFAMCFWFHWPHFWYCFLWAAVHCLPSMGKWGEEQQKIKQKNRYWGGILWEERKCCHFWWRWVYDRQRDRGASAAIAQMIIPHEGHVPWHFRCMKHASTGMKHHIKGKMRHGSGNRIAVWTWDTGVIWCSAGKWVELSTKCSYWKQVRDSADDRESTVPFFDAGGRCLFFVQSSPPGRDRCRGIEKVQDQLWGNESEDFYGEDGGDDETEEFFGETRTMTGCLGRNRNRGQMLWKKQKNHGQTDPKNGRTVRGWGDRWNGIRRNQELCQVKVNLKRPGETEENQKRKTLQQLILPGTRSVTEKGTGHIFWRGNRGRCIW